MLADLVTTVICVINCGPQRNCIMHMPVRILSESATANVCIQWTVCDADYKQVTVPMAASDTICDLCAADNNQCDLTCRLRGGLCSCNPSYNLDSDGKPACTGKC